MRHRRFALSICLMLVSIICGFSIFIAPITSFAAGKAALSLNLSAGPLGVTLTLRGADFPQGQVTFSYIDPQNVPGTFLPPSDENAQVQGDGTFVTTNLMMPGSGAAGVWKILVTDSTGAVWSIHYTALAAGVPSLVVSPTSGQSGDSISFTGRNWLPVGIHVNLMLMIGSTLLPLFDTPVVSDKSGKISGKFHLPSNIDAAQVTVTATDIVTGALRAEAQIGITSATPTPTTSPTVTATPVPTNTPVTIITPTDTSSHTILPPVGSDSARGPLSLSLKLVLGWSLLIASGLLVIIAVLMLVYWMPRSERRG